MSTRNIKAPRIVLAEDNPADVTLARMAPRGAGLDCTLRVIDDGQQALAFTRRDAPRDHDLARKRAAMHYFRKAASLDRFMQLGVIARDILSRKMPAATECAGGSPEIGGTA